MKLRAKVLSFVFAPTILFFVGIIAYISYTVNDIAIRNSEELLEASGEGLAHELNSELEHALSSVEALAQSLQGTVANNEELSRDHVNVMLRQLLEKNPSFITTWTFWEPDAFDGKDKEYVNADGHDETGRFIPVWSKDESGAFIAEALVGYDEPGVVQDNLNHVLQSGENHLFEPYSYEVGGKTFLMTSVASPVIVQGKTIGIVGVDISCIINLSDITLLNFKLFNYFS